MERCRYAGEILNPSYLTLLPLAFSCPVCILPTSLSILHAQLNILIPLRNVSTRQQDHCLGERLSSPFVWRIRHRSCINIHVRTCRILLWCTAIIYQCYSVSFVVPPSVRGLCFFCFISTTRLIRPPHPSPRDLLGIPMSLGGRTSPDLYAVRQRQI